MKYKLLIAEDVETEMILIKRLLQENFSEKIDWGNSAFTSKYAETKSVLADGVFFDISILDRNLGDDSNSFRLIKDYSAQLGFMILNSIQKKNILAINEFSNTYPDTEKLSKPFVREKFIREMTINFERFENWLKNNKFIDVFKERIRFWIPKSSIRYIEADGDEITYHYKIDDTWLTAVHNKRSLQATLPFLDRKVFCQINRWTIVNKQFILTFSRKEKSLSMEGSNGSRKSFDLKRILE